MRSRRTRSMSLWWATVVTQAAGLSGTPFSGHATSAEARASCMASSARSKEPASRMRVAMIRPDSRRKIDSTMAPGSAIADAGMVYGRFGKLRPHRHFANRTNLHASVLPTASRGNPGGPVNGLVQVFAVQDVVTGQLLFG